MQKKLIENKINSSLSYILISNVEVGPYTGLKSIQKIAEEIASDFSKIYNEY